MGAPANFLWKKVRRARKGPARIPPAQIARIEHSWKLASAAPDALAQAFYARLFARHPELRPLFQSDLEQQGRKWTTMLAFAVAGLRHPRAIGETIELLGLRHRSYGVTVEHYASFGAVLLDTLRSGLGEEFTPEVEKAWRQVYELLSERMVRGGGGGTS